MGLILVANIVIIDRAKKADVIFITPKMVSQTYTHSFNTIYIVFYDKAGKAFKLGSLTRFT